MNTLSKADLDRMHGAQLKDLAKRDILRVMSTASTSKIPYTAYPEYKKHAKWKGVPITIREASRQFGIPARTISRWAQKDDITTLRRTKREVYVDKADVAYAAEIRRQKPGAGRWLFRDDRTPHIKPDD